MEKFQLLLGGKLIEAIAEKIYFLLYKPSSQFLPVRIMHTSSSPVHIHVGFLEAVPTHLRLAVGKSQDEVGDVVLPSFVILAQSTWRDFSVILKRHCILGLKMETKPEFHETLQPMFSRFDLLILAGKFLRLLKKKTRVT